MDTVLIIVAVAAVIAVAALLFMRGRGARREAVQEDRREAVAPETGAPAAVKVPKPEEKRAVARETPSAPPAREEPVAAVEAPVPEPAAAERPRPQVTEAEIRDQVRTQLEAAERMLGELREAAASKALEELGQSSGSVEIMAEGLQEVRALVERKQWSQAKNKGEALHAQLSLLLQSARRETAS